MASSECQATVHKTNLIQPRAELTKSSLLLFSFFQRRHGFSRILVDLPNLHGIHGFTEFTWIYEYLNGFIGLACICLGFYEFTLIFINLWGFLHGFMSIFIDLRDLLRLMWICMDLNEFMWIFIDVQGFTLINEIYMYLPWFLWIYLDSQGLSGFTWIYT